MAKTKKDPVQAVMTALTKAAVELEAFRDEATPEEKREYVNVWLKEIEGVIAEMKS